MNEFGTTPAMDIKGGDAVQIGGRVREVFDTIMQSHSTLVRFYDDDGEVRAIRCYANETLQRLPFEAIAMSARAAGR